MPKATRRKKLKAADFQKKKLKVGKKIAPAANDTDASFKSQAIVVPTQKMGEAKPASELVNSRNQSLRDLIIQLRHYSAQSRKDALSGMRDLQNHQPDAFRMQLSLVFEASAPVMVDEEMSVRKSLVALYQDFVPTVTKEHVRPFMALIMAYTCAAMTHISEHIRLDGLKFLTIWQDHYPNLVALHAQKVIPNYLSMLATNGKSQSLSGSGTGSSLLVNPRSQLGSAKARVEVLESLFGFLKLILVKGGNKWWFFPTKAVQDGITTSDSPSLLSRWTLCRESGVVPNGYSQLLKGTAGNHFYHGGFELFGATATVGAHSGRSGASMIASDTKVEATIRNTYELNDCDELKAFIDVLMPTLVDLWLESQPSAFTPGSIALTPALAVMHTILKMVNLLWRSILVKFKDRVPRSWVAGWLKVITKHFMIHFPFGTGNFSVRDRQVDVTLQDMNILFCELLSHVILSGTDAGEEASSEWRDTMLDYMLDMFDGERESRKKDDSTVMVFSTQQLEATFPVVWSLLNTLDDEISAKFLKAVCDKSNTLWGTPSAIVSFEFLSRLLKTQNNPGDRSSLLVTDVMRDWLLLLPKRLWQLKATNPVFSQSILEVMIYTLKNNPGGFAQDNAVAAGFEAAIIPFFHVETAKGAIFGPFVMLPEPVQICAVTFLYYLPSWPEKLVRGYAECLTNPIVPSSVVSHAIETLDHRQHRSAMPLPFAIFGSLLLTVGVVGWTSSDKQALANSLTDDAGMPGTAIGTEEILAFRGRNVILRGAAAYWDRRHVIVEAAQSTLAHRPEIASLILPSLEPSLTSIGLPLDGFYGIAQAILTMTNTESLPLPTSLLETLAVSLVACVRCSYACAAGTEFRKASEHSLQASLSLLSRFQAIRHGALKDVERSIAAANKPLAHPCGKADLDVLSTLKIATRLMLGTEALRDLVTQDPCCMQILARIAPLAETYLADPANTVFGTQSLKEETAMLKRFLLG